MNGDTMGPSFFRLCGDFQVVMVNVDVEVVLFKPWDHECNGVVTFFCGYWISVWVLVKEFVK